MVRQPVPLRQSDEILANAGIGLAGGGIRIQMPLNFALVMTLAGGLLAPAAQMPSIGEKAPDFVLESARGQQARLSELYAQSSVVLVVLRGFPGYQCPFCQRQVADYAARAKSFADSGVKVVFVYPGPPDTTKDRARSFLEGKEFPQEFEMLLDPGYAFTNQYGLRWNAERETAYPTTMFIRKGGTIVFVKSAVLHGGRTTAAEMLELLPKPRPK